MQAVLELQEVAVALVERFESVAEVLRDEVVCG